MHLGPKQMELLQACWPHHFSGLPVIPLVLLRRLHDHQMAVMEGGVRQITLFDAKNVSGLLSWWTCPSWAVPPVHVGAKGGLASWINS